MLLFGAMPRIGDHRSSVEYRAEVTDFIDAVAQRWAKLLPVGDYMYVGHFWPPWSLRMCPPGDVVKILERFAGETWSAATRGLARPGRTGVGSFARPLAEWACGPHRA